MTPLFLLQTVQACSPSSLNINNWIGINVLVVLAFLSISSMIYALSNLMPNSYREKLRRILVTEFTECIISVVLIVSLVTLSYTACTIGAGISGLGSSYQNIFQADNYYIGSLLFSKGTAITSGLITQGLFLSIDGQIANQILTTYANTLNNAQKSSSGSSTGAVSLTSSYGGELYPLFNNYASVYVTYSGLVVLTFGVLFVLFFLLPIISATGLTLLIPVAIIMRCLAFAGPKLREASNSLLALAIALYFVLPLAIAMNGYIVSWVYCTSPASAGGLALPSAPTTSCNPYAKPYLNQYQLNNIPVSTFFSQNTVDQYNAGSLQTNFLGAVVSSTGSIVDTVQNLVKGLVAIPYLLSGYTNQVAEYLFEGIVLVALDFAITLGFAQSINKGLNAIPAIIGSGSFW